MCGIAGYISSKSYDHSNVLKNMGNAINHRGPDATGIWFDEDKGIAFCHKRLSILDLSEAGAQPMFSTNGRYVMVFNGEIYNYLEIRDELDKIDNTYVWVGHSDTEVILRGIEIWGLDLTLTKMIGMFAIALWDRQHSTLYLVRDRLGEKPLYYGWQGETLIFGSELKAFHEHPAFNKEINEESVALFFKYNYVPAGTSIYKGIKKLKPGYYARMSLQTKEIEYREYWSLENHVSTQYEGSEHDAINDLETLLKQTISRQMISDVPLGAFLSGGVDSSTIVALMQAQSSRAIRTFSIGFNKEGFDEAVYAKKVAEHLGTQHIEMYVSEQDALNVIPHLADIYDEPFSDSSQIPTYLVAKLAKTDVTVSLSGDAGDELFAGYNRYLLAESVWKKMSKIPIGFRKGIGQYLQNINAKKLDSIYSATHRIVPTKYRVTNFSDKVHKLAHRLAVASPERFYDSLISHWDPKQIMSGAINNNINQSLNTQLDISFIEKMMLTDSQNYLPDDILVKVDRAAMANSLETRVPFLDHKIVEFAWGLPMPMKIKDGTSKWILREVLYKYVPKQLIERPKMGFAVPLDEWLRGTLKDWACDLLSAPNLDKHQLLNKQEVQRKLNEHISGKRNWQYQLWDILMFQCWYNKYHS